MDLDMKIGAGMIRRFHTMPLIGEQTVGHHTYNVVQILRHITNDMLSINLLKAALDHDVMEYFTGDVPHPTKQAFPNIAEALQAVEKTMSNELNIDYELEEDEVNLLKWADMMEAGMFGYHQMTVGNRYAMDIVANAIVWFSDQKGMPQRLVDMVNELGDNFSGGE